MLVGITLLTFLLSHAVPADPVTASLGEQAQATVQRISGASERNAEAMTTLFPHGRPDPR